MNALYLIRKDRGKISVSDFAQILSDIPGVTGLKKEDVFLDLVEADYACEGDRTILRLDKKEEVISIHGIGKASVRAVYEIQKRYGHELRLFDQDYTFDINLEEINSLQELETKMN